MRNLGLMYQGGEGAPQDLAESARWLRKAIALGNTLAQENLKEVDREQVEYKLKRAASYKTEAGASTNDARCPSMWSDLTDKGDYPAVCNVNGLICFYLKGQAVCEPDGPLLKWQELGLTNGCAEFPPTIGSGCSSPGLRCGYITEPPGPANMRPTEYCCNGNRHQWENQGIFCPNGNTCGTVHASHYDQSCSKDSDCVSISDGNFCDANCHCVDAAINIAAQPQYEADLASKNNGAAPICPCPPSPRPACRAGVCRVGEGAMIEGDGYIPTSEPTANAHK